ncbi:hypothetical protein Q0O81_13805, partial [Staphylococcus aureus]|nr:hypothetical protein [Staphylococcus aureus]
GLTATTPVRPLAQEPPYAMGVALERAKRLKNKIKKIKIYHLEFSLWRSGIGVIAGALGHTLDP